jgi:transposase-like protein
MKTKSQYQAVRYSEAFKIQLVREVESGQINREQCRRKYGVRGKSTLQKWARKYGNGTIGKVIRVETPKEINEKAVLKQRIKDLERALASSNVELMLEREYTAMACERAGVDVDEFKKKVAGKRRTVG